MWKIVEVNGDYVILPEHEVVCPVCGGEVLLHDFSCKYQASFSFYHCDVHMKCLNCGFFMTFGVPVSREDYEKLTKSKYHAKILKWELREIVRDFRKVEERLRRLGYW